MLIASNHFIDHVMQPFSLTGNAGIQPPPSATYQEKIQMVALAVLAGLAAGVLVNPLTGMLVGAVVFYAVTGFHKLKLHALFNQRARPTNQISQKHDAPPSKKMTAEAFSEPIYNSSKNHFEQIFPRVEQLVTHYQTAVAPSDKKNIQRVVRFGDWQGMDYKIEKQAVKQGKDFRLLEKMAVEMPELGNCIFVNARGNGECGYRSLVIGLLHGDCILKDNVEGLILSCQTAFDRLIGCWNSLPLNPEAKRRFDESRIQACAHLDRMKNLSTEERMALLQDEAFLASFLVFVRCIIVSQTKYIANENIDDEQVKNRDQTNNTLKIFSDNLNLGEKDSEFLSYALANYSLDALLGNAELPDRFHNDKQNKGKDHIREIVRRANDFDHNLMRQLKDLLDHRDELSNKTDILSTPLPEYMDLGITLDEFLVRKALGDADSPQPLWALGSDFTALGYALNINICCIVRDAFKDNVFDVVKTFRDRSPAFYGINLSGPHYNVLLPALDR